jgi:putative transposase
MIAAGGYGRTSSTCWGYAARRGKSNQTIYTWRKQFGRLKHLEAENARLKKLVAERDLEIEVMKEVAAKNW